MLAPAKPWFYSDMLLLIGLEYLGICTALCPHGGPQDGPALRVGGRHVGTASSASRVGAIMRKTGQPFLPGSAVRTRWSSKRPAIAP